MVIRNSNILLFLSVKIMVKKNEWVVTARKNFLNRSILTTMNFTKNRSILDSRKTKLAIFIAPTSINRSVSGNCYWMVSARSDTNPLGGLYFCFNIRFIKDTFNQFRRQLVLVTTGTALTLVIVSKWEKLTSGCQNKIMSVTTNKSLYLILQRWVWLTSLIFYWLLISKP